MLNLYLEDISHYREIILEAGSIAERLTKEIAVTSKLKSCPEDFMYIIDALQARNTIPAEIASYLHTLRVFANKARHREGQRIDFKRIDVENIFGILLRTIEWYYCEYPDGPKYPRIYRELPEIPRLLGSTIGPNAALYCLGAPFAGLIFQTLSVDSETVFVAFILVLLGISVLVQFRKSEKFIGLRKQSDFVERFRSYEILYFVSLLVLLNLPLLSTSYTGIDPYGFFLAFPSHAKLWAIISNLVINFILSAGGGLLFSYIALEWAKRKPDDIIASTFTSVLIPIFLVYVVASLTQTRGMESYFLTAFFPLSLAFLAIIGYSHQENRLEPFTAKFLFVACVVFMAVGFILAMGGLLYSLSNLTGKGFPIAYENHLWKSVIAPERIGYPASEYIERLKGGFTWQVLAASFYLVLAVGFLTVMTIFNYQLKPALKKTK